jgi:hypothetical protein
MTIMADPARSMGIIVKFSARSTDRQDGPGRRNFIKNHRAGEQKPRDVEPNPHAPDAGIARSPRQSKITYMPDSKRLYSFQ